MRITDSTTSGVRSGTLAPLRDARVVDEHVDATEIVLDPAGERLDAVEIGEVDGPAP